MGDFFSEENLEGDANQEENGDKGSFDFILPDRKHCVFLNIFDPVSRELVNREQDEIGFETWEALKGSDRELFQKGGVIVMPSFDERDNVSLETFDADKMVGLLSEIVTFVKIKYSRGKLSLDIITTPPRPIANYILKNCDHSELKSIHTCINHPFVLRTEADDSVKSHIQYRNYSENVSLTKGYEFRIVNEGGLYDNGVYLNPRASAEIKTYDTLEEADYILKDVFKDFPYASNASLANSIGQLISGCMRYCMGSDMPPIALTTSQVHGSGKSMETDCIHCILYGIPAEWSPRINTIDEYRKTLLTHALAGSPMICFDNLNDKLDIEALASVATSRRLSGRMLHTMNKVTVENMMSICLNGTALDVSTEIVDRTIWKVMDTHIKSADRTFKYKAIIDSQIIPNRPAILSAVFTYIANWIDKGCKISEEKAQKHRAKVWSGLIGGVMQDTIWYEDFLGNSDKQRLQADTTYVRWQYAMDEVGKFIGIKHGSLYTNPFTIKEIMTVCSYIEDYQDKQIIVIGDNMLGEDIGTESKNDQSRATKLGILFRSKSKNGGTPYGNWKILDAGQLRRRRMFKLEWIGKEMPSDEYYKPVKDEDGDHEVPL